MLHVNSQLVLFKPKWTI